MKKVLCLLFAVMFLLVGCGKETNDMASMSKKINEYLGVTPYLPESDYPIGHIHIEYRPEVNNDEIPKSDPWKATVEYKISQDEELDEELRKEWEEQEPLKEIIYGELYMDQSAALVNIYPGGPGNIMDAEMIEINGHDVQYQYVQNENFDSVMMLMELDDIGYEIQYFAEKNNIEEEAKEFAREIIENYDI